MQLKSAGFLIKNTDGLFICGKPSNNNFYTIPKGQLNENESTIDAAYRETLEEIGLDLRNINGSVKYIGEITYKVKRDTKTLYMYMFTSSVELKEYTLKCTTFYEDKFGNTKPELQDFKFVSYDELVRITYKSLSKLLTENNNTINE